MVRNWPHMLQCSCRESPYTSLSQLTDRKQSLQPTPEVSCFATRREAASSLQGENPAIPSARESFNAEPRLQTRHRVLTAAARSSSCPCCSPLCTSSAPAGDRDGDDKGGGGGGGAGRRPREVVPAAAAGRRARRGVAAPGRGVPRVARRQRVARAAALLLRGRRQVSWKHSQPHLSTRGAPGA